MEKEELKTEKTEKQENAVKKLDGWIQAEFLLQENFDEREFNNKRKSWIKNGFSEKEALAKVPDFLAPYCELEKRSDAKLNEKKEELRDRIVLIIPLYKIRYTFGQINRRIFHKYLTAKLKKDVHSSPDREFAEEDSIAVLSVTVSSYGELRPIELECIDGKTKPIVIKDIKNRKHGTLDDPEFIKYSTLLLAERLLEKQQTSGSDRSKDITLNEIHMDSGVYDQIIKDICCLCPDSSDSEEEEENFDVIFKLLYNYVVRQNKDLYDRIMTWVDTLSPEIREKEGLTDVALKDFQSNMNNVYCECFEGGDVEKKQLYDAGLGINSFYIKDMEMIRERINDGGYGKDPDNAYENAVLDFIISSDESVDETLRTNISRFARGEDKDRLEKYFKEYVSVNNAPLGKWPGGNSPYLMQQMAVNSFVSDAAPIFTVNGPPGTGKTTLLKEVIAGKITEKVKRLADILQSEEVNYDPLNMFSPVGKEYKINYPELYDYSMVVVSGTNNAVENITKELPKKLKDSQVYKDILKEVLQEISNEYDGRLSEYLKEMHHLPVMAPLGRKANLEGYRRKFLNENSKYMIPEEDWKYYGSLKKIIRDDENKSSKHAEKQLLKNLTDSFEECYENAEDIKGKLLEWEKEERNDEVRNNIWERYIGEKYIDSEKENQYRLAQLLDSSCFYKEYSDLRKDFDDIREELFVRGWLLHQVFAWVATPVRMNFSRIIEAIYEGRNIDEDNSAVRIGLYNSLFFVSPVMSSTFASIERTFRYLPIRESLGILIVDEAGQILPQAALGSLYRVKKALIVGDPKQIPPVVPPEQNFALELACPEFMGESRRLMEEGRKAGKLIEDNTPSLQRYSDRINPYGTMIDGTWVGCPMVIHSRCISPMFEMSNALSYENSMISRTIEPDEAKKNEFILEHSCWIRIRGKEGGGERNHFVTRQAEAVCKMVLEKRAKLAAKEKGYDDLSLFVITPFKSVENGLKNYIELHVIKGMEDKKDKDSLKKWTEKCIGTVHTFQGKEADEVILLLGLENPENGSEDEADWIKNKRRNSKNAAAWINKNIVNVAVSRAKYRFYFVGDVDIFRKKRGSVRKSPESPVNLARRLMDRVYREKADLLPDGEKSIISISDLNDRLDHSFKLPTRKEKQKFICPVCRSDVIKGRYGWFCKGKKEVCGLQFKVYIDEGNEYQAYNAIPMNTETVRKLINGEKVIYDAYVERTDSYKRFKINPEIKDDVYVITPIECGGHTIEHKKSVKLFEFEEDREIEYSRTGKLITLKRDDGLPDFLYCNCTKILQELRSSSNRNNINIDYFAIMILDVVFTIREYADSYGKWREEAQAYNKESDEKIRIPLTVKKEKDRIKFNTMDILRILSGNPYADHKSALLDRIDGSLQKLISSGLYKTSYAGKQNDILLPNVESRGKHLYYYTVGINESFLYEFLARESSLTNNTPFKGTFSIATKCLNPKYESDDTKESDKPMFPINEKWLMIKYYILYSIGLRYRMKRYNGFISFTNMATALNLDALEKKPKSEKGKKNAENERVRKAMERRRFRKKIVDYMEYLSGFMIRSYKIVDSEDSEGYCGLAGVRINPRPDATEK